MKVAQIAATERFLLGPVTLDSGGKALSPSCLADRVEFFRRNKRYAKCWAETTGEGWARAVAAAGYATDPDYAKKLIVTMRGCNLARFDERNAA